MILEALCAELSANAGFAAAAPGGLYPHVAPQETPYPMATYSVDADQTDALLDGSISSMRRLYVSIDCYALTLLEVNTLASAVEAALLPTRGLIGDSVSPAEIDSVRLTRRLGLFESDSRLYRSSLQFDVGYYP